MAVTAGLGGLGYLIAARRPKASARQLLTGERNTSVRDLSLEGSGIERFFDAILGFIRDFGQKVTPMSLGCRNRSAYCDGGHERPVDR